MGNASIDFSPRASEKGTVRLSLKGSFGAEDVPRLREWAKLVQQTVEKTGERALGKVKVLIDIRQLEGYSDPEVLAVLATLMKADDPHVSKTASFGGTKIHEFAQDIIKGFAGRDNLKNFATEKEALAWLNG